MLTVPGAPRLPDAMSVFVSTGSSPLPSGDGRSTYRSIVPGVASESMPGMPSCTLAAVSPHIASR